jgi:hypothetical protein
MAIFASTEHVVGFIKLRDDSGLLARSGGEGKCALELLGKLTCKVDKGEELNAFDQGLWGSSKIVVYEIFGVGRSVEDNPPTRERAIAEKKNDIVHDDLNPDLECGLVKSTKHVHDLGYVGKYALEGLPKEQNRPIG